MRTDFKQLAKLGSWLAKDYALDFLQLIVAYHSISASEAASRLDLHIKTAQDFLEGLWELGLLDRKEVHESKRPYYRYRLKKSRIQVDFDLRNIFQPEGIGGNIRSKRIRENKNAPVIFNITGGNQYISSLVIHSGSGRRRRERRINLTRPQGRFLYHLPFPTAQARTVNEIMSSARIGLEYSGEVISIVQLLIEQQVIEVV